MVTTPADNAASAAPAAPPAKAPPSAIEFEPPLACVRRILKNSLPHSTNVGKDASTAFSRACGIFIIYLTACANDFARESKRQTITANDVLAAVQELDFGEFVPDMTACLENYRQAEKSKKDAKAAAAAAKAAAVSTPQEGDEAQREEEDEEEDAEDESSVSAKPAAKKRPREEENEEKEIDQESSEKRLKTNEEEASATAS